MTYCRKSLHGRISSSLRTWSELASNRGYTQESRVESQEEEQRAGDVRFGTDGWRGVIAREFTFDNVARVAQATAGFLLSKTRKELAIYREWGAQYRSAANGVIIGYDTRFLSREFA
ncbi:hypothetical protein KAX17_12620, partial [Candidatus Bipolaricaulota bacterium]|nr:hypothetical protein [Candidatus Bipolaricaulota bacterium]